MNYSTALLVSLVVVGGAMVTVAALHDAGKPKLAPAWFCLVGALLAMTYAASLASAFGKV